MNVSNWKEDGYNWIDPASDGTDLRVYCDMTTDGGKGYEKSCYD